MIPESGTYVSSLTSGLSGVNHNQDYFTPVKLTAPAGTPRQNIAWPGWIMEGTPVPAEIYSAINYLKSVGDTDRGFAIYDEVLDRWYNLHGTDYADTTIKVSAAGVYDPSGSGWWNNAAGPYSGRASGAAFAAGMIRPEEMQAAIINHALAIALPPALIRQSTHSGFAVSPATTSDGTGGPNAIPMGQRFRLDPSLTQEDLISLGLNRANDLVVARALQRYGAYVVDSSASACIYYQSGLGSSSYRITNPWPAAIIQYLEAIEPPKNVVILDDPSTYGAVKPN